MQCAANAQMRSGSAMIAEMSGLFLALDLVDRVMQYMSRDRVWTFEMACDNRPLVDMINAGRAYDHCGHVRSLVAEFLRLKDELQSRPVVAGHMIHGACRHRIRLRWKSREHWHLQVAHELARDANYHCDNRRFGAWRSRHLELLTDATLIVATAPEEDMRLWQERF